MEQVVHLFTNNPPLRKAVEEALTGVRVRTYPIGARAASPSGYGGGTSSLPRSVKLGLGGTPTRADAIVTRSSDTGALQRFAMGKRTPYVVILPDMADWFLTQVTERGMSILIGSDAARTWA